MLRLADLPYHPRLAVTFDVLVLGYWPGGGCTIEDHPWYNEQGGFMGNIDIELGSVTFECLCSPSGSDIPSNRGFRSWQLSSGTALCEVNSEGAPEPYWHLQPEGTIYRVTTDFTHTSATLALMFRRTEGIVSSLDWYGIEVDTPTFAIDNVRVEACPLTGPCLNPEYRGTAEGAQRRWWRCIGESLITRLRRAVLYSDPQVGDQREAEARHHRRWIGESLFETVARTRFLPARACEALSSGPTGEAPHEVDSRHARVLARLRHVRPG